MVDAIPLSLQTTYRDLLDRQARRPSPEVEGSVLGVENKDNPYWVVRHRIGGTVTERRIGPDGDAAVREKAERLRQENKALQAWARDTAGLVAQLRAARMPTPTTGTGKLINALSRAGLFRSGGILAGTHAFGLYALELGVRLHDSLVMTEDVDIAAARSIRVIMDQSASLTASIAGIGLRPVAGPDQPHPVRWETSEGVALDVLTSRRRGSHAVVRLEGLGIGRRRWHISSSASSNRSTRSCCTAKASPCAFPLPSAMPSTSSSLRLSERARIVPRSRRTLRKRRR